MANQLSKTGITNSQTIQAWHVSQSVDALTGTSAYDITISGSLTLTGSVESLNGFTGNLIGTASRATEASITTQVRPSNTTSNFGYTVPYLSGTGSLASLYYSTIGPTYNPSTETITSANFSGSLAGTSAEVDYIQLNTGSSVTGQPGRIWWNDTEGTVNIRLKNNNVTLQVGQELVTRAYNATGGPLNENEYRVVYISGSDTLSGAPKVYLAQSNDPATTQTTLGMVTETIQPGQTGYITTHGLVRGIDTTMFAPGDTLYLSPTVPGGVTATRVSPPNLDVIIGYVITSDPQGQIYIDIRAGYEFPQYISSFSTGSQTATLPNTAYAVTFNTSSLSSAMSRVGTRFYASRTGLYDIQYSAQINRFASSGTATVSIWLKKDGTDVPFTNRNFSSTGNTGTANQVASSNYFVSVNSGSYVELYWSTDDIDIGFQYIAPAGSPTRPATPSFSATLNKVS